MFGDSQNRRMREHSRRISRDVNRSTLGSHAGGSLHARHAKGYGNDINFSSRRKSARANSGLIDVVTPNTRSGEDARAYSRRVAQLDFSKRAMRRDRFQRVGLIVGILVVIAVAVAAVAGFTYVNSVSSNMSLDDPEARAALVAPTADQPYYVLVAGFFSEQGGQEDADALALARVDTASKQVSLASLPPNVVVGSGSSETFLSKTCENGGDAALIKAAAQLVGVDIAHYVRVDAEAFVRLVDAVGGITVNVPEEVDDPYAGSIYIPAGEQTLSGEQALVYARARNYADSTIQRQEAQLDIMTALAQKVFDAGTTGLPGVVDALSGSVKTDWKASDITALVEALRGMDVSSVAKVQLPGYVSTNNEGQTEFTESSSWSTALDSFKNNGTVEASSGVDTSGVDPASFTIIVRNGGGITGAAANFASILTEQGFQVTDTGNADSQVYEETLVIYKDDAKEACAQAVVDAMGTGRITNASAYYSFDSDVLVMIGRDYLPTA